jgi:arginine utilization regulatory protein
LDILTEHFINKYNNILGKEALKLDDRLKEQMRNYHWPGNVRELEHMLAGALTLVQDENVIGLEHIPDHYMQAFHNDSLPLGTDTPPLTSLSAWADRPPAEATMLTEGGPGPLKSGPGIGTQPAVGPAVSPTAPALPPPASENWATTDSGMVRRIKQEEKALRDCLTACRGNLTKSARMMGISRQLFTYRLLKHGLDYRDFK